MIIKTAKFVASNSDVKKCPPPLKPEYAFIGRSNVGKSSLINMLADNKHLAMTSSTPGKTQLINHYIINDSWYLVDLPGFGYAKVSKKLKEQFSTIITNYLKNRTNLMCVFVLIDSRLEPQQIDLDFLFWLGTNHIPFVLAFTKADKITQKEVAKNVEIFKEKLLEEWEELPQIFVTSSEKKLGRKQILNWIHQTNQSFVIPAKD
jgi:GTP-binding protein